MIIPLTDTEFLSEFPRSPSPVHKLGGKASPPLKVTTEVNDSTYSPLAEIPAYQPTKAGGEKIEKAELMVITSQPAKQEMTSIAPALLSPAIDPALMQPMAPRQDISPVMQGKRPMPPAMHRLNTNLSGDGSAPSSVISSSPETPLGMHFGMYAESQGQESFEDLSRVPSRSDLITRKGTNTSASSEDGVINGDQNQGGVPAPKAKKSHARKVRFLDSSSRATILTISNLMTISKEPEMR